MHFIRTNQGQSKAFVALITVSAMMIAWGAVGSQV